MPVDTRAVVVRAGRAALADELCAPRCELGLAELGERTYNAARQERMGRRAAELEPLVGAELDKLLAAGGN